jgi:hypothetical protein
MPDFIPTTDADFEIWLNTLLFALQASPADYGLTPADITPLLTAQSTWSTSYLAQQTAKTAAEAATSRKDDCRMSAENTIRMLARRIQATPGVTDEAKKKAGLPVHDTIKTLHAAPATRPIGEVDTSERLRHTIHFKDQTAPRKAKPKDVMGCEIWAKIGGAPPTDPAECQFVALDTNSPYLNQFTGADAGKTVHYLLRWVSTRGGKGPWSETISATIPA